MRLALLSLLFCLISFISNAQKEQSEEDSLEVNHRLTIEIAPVIHWNTIFNEMTAFAGVQVSGIIHEKVIVGIHGEYFLGDLSKRIVFPNFYNFNQFKLGVNGGYNIRIHPKFHIRPKLNILYSNARWVEKNEKRFYASDSYLEFYPQITLAIFPSNKVYLISGFGYNFVDSSNLIGASNSDLSGINLFAGVQFKLTSK